MPDMKLNSGMDDAVIKFKLMGISVIFGINALVFI